MDLRRADIIEAIIDELALGEFGQEIGGFTLTRLGEGEGELLLDYGSAGRFKLEVTEL